MSTTYDGGDSDGLGALLEHAFGLSPFVNDNNPLVVTDGSTFTPGVPKTDLDFSAGLDFAAQFVRRTDGSLSYTVQFSADMMIWEDSTEIPTVVSSNGGDYEVVEVPYLVFLPGGEKARFFRVVVTVN